MADPFARYQDDPSDPGPQRQFRYGTWDGGPDPLAPPFDTAAAVDAIGDAVLDGASPRQALRDLLRRGNDRLRGLDSLRREAERRRRDLQRSGRMDGLLEQVRELLEQAKDTERLELSVDDSDAARMAEMELETLPDDTARQVRAMSEYQWRSEQAQQKFAELQELLRSEVLDQQFAGMKQAMEQAAGDPAARQRIADMMADLNAMLAADARGEHTQEQFEQFMEKNGEFFPENPQNLEELTDALARRAAAGRRLMRSLSPEQREELGNLMNQTLDDLGLASEMSQLNDRLRAARPDLDWDGRQKMTGDRPMGLGEATEALAELADLEELVDALGQDYPGASMDDIDEDAVARALGRAAVDDLDALRRLERELEQQGFTSTDGGRMELTPKAMRRLGLTALRRVFGTSAALGRGEHETRSAGAAGDVTGSTRAWEFGDTQPLDVVRTVRNAVLRNGPGKVRLAVEDFEVVETERRSGAAVALLVDLSYSMLLRGTWVTAKQTMLALHALVTTMYPQDEIQVIGFSQYARVLRPNELSTLEAEQVQGTNLQHALMLAGRFLGKHPDSEPVVLCVTDGEPTAHLERDGHAWFSWPPDPETITATMAEVDRVTRRGATITFFLLDDDPGLVALGEEMARRNGGRVFSTSPERLGEYVVSDYLSRRKGSRRAG